MRLDLLLRAREGTGGSRRRRSEVCVEGAVEEGWRDEVAVRDPVGL